MRGKGAEQSKAQEMYGASYLPEKPREGEAIVVVEVGLSQSGRPRGGGCGL